MAECLTTPWEEIDARSQLARLFNGKLERKPNPEWPRINAEWHEAHPDFRCAASVNCEICEARDG